MSTFVEYTIGRRNTDIVIADAGVSRLHAELVTADGRFYITDCDSTSGTQVYRHGWQPIQQGFVEAQEKLRLGGKVYTVLELLSMLVGVSGEAEDASGVAGKIGAKSKPNPKDALPDGEVKRDALTGEIIGSE